MGGNQQKKKNVCVIPMMMMMMMIYSLPGNGIVLFPFKIKYSIFYPNHFASSVFHCG
jgi:hypothetical protein